MIRKFFIRLGSWEYWPMYLVYIPVYIYYLLLSIRTGSFFFFTASNPGIENGGMLGESKFPILEKIRKKPKTLKFSPNTTLQNCAHGITNAGMAFPLIAKPDIGERGWGVKRLDHENDLKSYLDWTQVDFLIQEFVDLPLEAGVFYHRFPGEDSGAITSVVYKEFLSVTGDGRSTLRELIQSSDRALLQLEKLEEVWNTEMENVIESSKRIELVGVGNHSLGTQFINATNRVTEAMVENFDAIAKKYEGFYFGRFDLRCKDWESLEKGEVLILELNGAGSEPAHIYEPGFPIFKGIGSLLFHMRLLFKISRANHKLGVPYMTFREGWREIQKIRKYNKAYK